MGHQRDAAAVTFGWRDRPLAGREIRDGSPGGIDVASLADRVGQGEVSERSYRDVGHCRIVAGRCDVS